MHIFPIHISRLGFGRNYVIAHVEFVTAIFDLPNEQVSLDYKI